MDALARRVVAPLVEGTDDRLAVDAGIVAQMRAQMRAMRVGYHRLAGFGAKQHQVASKVFERLDPLSRELVGEADDEPAGRIGVERVAGIEFAQGSHAGPRRR